GAQIVQAGAGGTAGVREAADGAESGEIELHHLDRARRMRRGDRRGRGVTLALIATGEDDVRTLAGELQGGFVTNAAVGAGDDERFAGLRRDVVGGPGPVGAPALLLVSCSRKTGNRPDSGCGGGYLT